MQLHKLLTYLRMSHQKCAAGKEHHFPKDTFRCRIIGTLVKDGRKCYEKICLGINLFNPTLKIWDKSNIYLQVLSFFEFIKSKKKKKLYPYQNMIWWTEASSRLYFTFSPQNIYSSKWSCMTSSFTGVYVVLEVP